MSKGGHNRIKGSIYDYKSLDIHLLQREGRLAEEGIGYYKYYWRSGRTGESFGHITVFTTPEYIRLIYTTTDRVTGDKQDHDFRVSVEWTTCNYGGKRAWFLCAKCGRRIRKLYLKNKYFYCRHCQQLNYYSQQQSKSDQRMEGIRERIYYVQKQLKEIRLNHDTNWIPRPK